MLIFKIDTDGNAGAKNIKGDLKSLQAEVGGLITLANYYEELDARNIDIFADDEGLLKSNPIITFFVTSKENKYKSIATLVGNLVFASHDDEDNTLGLSQKQLSFIKEHLKKVAYINKDTNQVKLAYTFWFQDELKTIRNNKGS